MSAAPQPRLITLAISPFNELARWSLERAGIAYREDRRALVEHVVASRRAGGKGTTPVLVVDGEVVADSVDIARWADRHAGEAGRLYPPGSARDEADGLVVRYARELGPQARRLIWAHLIDAPGLAHSYWSAGISPARRRLQPLALRLAKPAIRRDIGLDPPAARAAPERIRAVFDEVADRLADGRAHLLGDALTVADIAFAAMASPAVLPPDGYPVSLPSPHEFPEPIAAEMLGLRAHPAGEYALRLYRDAR